jgi:hypothetical protein
MRREGMPSAVGFSSTAIAPSALRSPAASAARWKSAASVSPLCRTRACKPFSRCRRKSCFGKRELPRPAAKCTVAPKPSFFSPGKSGGPGRSMPRRNCPAASAFSAPSTAGLPITGPACLDPVLFQTAETGMAYFNLQEANVSDGIRVHEGGLSPMSNTRS